MKLARATELSTLLSLICLSVTSCGQKESDTAQAGSTPVAPIPSVEVTGYRAADALGFSFQVASESSKVRKSYRIGTSLAKHDAGYLRDEGMQHLHMRDVHARGQMEEPRYSDINDEELRAIEAELGHSVTRELAQWFIRNRTNREAVERMLQAENTNGFDNIKKPQIVRNINRPDAQSQASVLKKVKKQCA